MTYVSNGFQALFTGERLGSSGGIKRRYSNLADYLNCIRVVTVVKSRFKQVRQSDYHREVIVDRMGCARRRLAIGILVHSLARVNFWVQFTLLT